MTYLVQITDPRQPNQIRPLTLSVTPAQMADMFDQFKGHVFIISELKPFLKIENLEENESQR